VTQSSIRAEIGLWIMLALRTGLGYNAQSATAIGPNFLAAPVNQGFYFVLTTKLSNLFDLVGRRCNSNGVCIDLLRSENQLSTELKDSGIPGRCNLAKVIGDCFTVGCEAGSARDVFELRVIPRVKRLYAQFEAAASRLIE
jgi:hypothetical protein